MDWKQAFRWGGAYFGWTTLFAVVGLALVGAGVYDVYATAAPLHIVKGLTVPVPTKSGVLGVVLTVLGFAVYRLGKAWALYRTLTAAVEAEVSDTYDTEHVKSDIVSVLDDRLDDMQHDLQSVNREIRDLNADDGSFETGAGSPGLDADGTSTTAPGTSTDASAPEDAGAPGNGARTEDDTPQ